MVEIRSRQKYQYDAAIRLVQVKNDSSITSYKYGACRPWRSLYLMLLDQPGVTLTLSKSHCQKGNRYPCGIMSGQQAALATLCLPRFNKINGGRFMLRDELSFREASNGSVRNGLVEYVANQLTVVFRPTKVLPSACE
jgi:hypothetical protein